MGPSTSSEVSGSKRASRHMPYTSEVDGKTMRRPCFTHWRTMGRLASKSSSNTRSGSFTYSAGVAMATSGSTVSHLRT